MKNTNWSTNLEIEYINNIGDHMEYCKATKLEMLRRYELALEMRTQWNNINQEKLRTALDELIMTLSLQA